MQFKSIVLSLMIFSTILHIAAAAGQGIIGFDYSGIHGAIVDAVSSSELGQRNVGANPDLAPEDPAKGSVNTANFSPQSAVGYINSLYSICRCFEKLFSGNSLNGDNTEEKEG